MGAHSAPGRAPPALVSAVRPCHCVPGLLRGDLGTVRGWWELSSARSRVVLVAAQEILCVSLQTDTCFRDDLVASRAAACVPLVGVAGLPRMASSVGACFPLGPSRPFTFDPVPPRCLRHADIFAGSLPGWEESAPPNP